MEFVGATRCDEGDASTFEAVGESADVDEHFFFVL